MNQGALASIVTLALFCSGQERREPEMTRDDLYGSALEKLRALEKAWKDQSPDVPQAVEELERAVSRLRATSAEEELKPQSKTIPAPEGPFPPSSRPSPEDEQERRRRATEERFPSGGPLEKETTSLQGVSDERIQSSCDRAQAELIRFGELRAKDRGAAERSLQSVANTLRGMSKPSQ